jgi:transcription elongation factor GreA
MVTDPVFVTPEGHRKLVDELRYLIDVRRPQVAHLIGEAKDAGDVSENAAYEEAKDQQAFVEGRIRRLEDILSRAELIEPASGTDLVMIGSEVTVVEDGGPPESFRLVGSAEADPSGGLISNESPLGRALLGKRTGDQAAIETPDGATIVFRIVRVA